MPRQDVIALFGPTAVGKTDVAIALAALLRTHGEQPVAVSADALQVYQGLEVLTGAADRAERSALEHRLISFLPVDAQFSAGQYAELAHNEIDELLATGRRPMVVGGTGLYLRAALAELSLRPPPAEGVRERWAEQLYRPSGRQALHAELCIACPVGGRGHRTDETFTGFCARARAARGRRARAADRRVRAVDASDTAPDAARRARIGPGSVCTRRSMRGNRTHAGGSEWKMRSRRASGAGASDTARKALGFDELLSGDVEAMKRRTRNYARRQLTWMRKLPGVLQLDVTDRTADDVAAEIAGAWLGS